MDPKPLVNLFYTVEFVCDGFACNANSPMTLHFVDTLYWKIFHRSGFLSSLRLPWETKEFALAVFKPGELLSPHIVHLWS